MVTLYFTQSSQKRLAETLRTTTNLVPATSEEKCDRNTVVPEKK